MDNLKNIGLIEVLNENVLEKNKHTWDILGMQLMASFGRRKCYGLGWFDCKVSSFEVNSLDINTSYRLE